MAAVGGPLGGLLAAVPVGAVVAVLATVDPEDGLRPDLEPTDVTPGVVGFAVTALVVVGLIGILLSMVVKLRRVNLGAERPAPPWATDAGSDGTAGEVPGEDHDDDSGRERRPDDPPTSAGPQR